LLKRKQLETKALLTSFAGLGAIRRPSHRRQLLSKHAPVATGEKRGASGMVMDANLKQQM
jgi:hypothetical protein